MAKGLSDSLFIANVMPRNGALLFIGNLTTNNVKIYREQIEKYLKQLLDMSFMFNFAIV